MKTSQNIAPLAILIFLAVCITVSPTPALAQNQVKALEKRVKTLESRVALLTEQMEALLGTDSRFEVQKIPLGGSPTKGTKNARVILVMFGDYQSDYTVRAQSVINRLLRSYKGKIRFAYKHFPLNQIHPMASKASMAAIAAGNQGRYWEMHELLLQNGNRLDDIVLTALAEKLGLNLTKFTSDISSLSTLEKLDKDEKLAKQIGVAGAPTVYLNGRPLPSWRFDYVRGEINKILK